jgi:hypothetical protein
VYGHAESEKNFFKPVDQWPVDSDRVLKTTEENGAAEARKKARRCFGISIMLAYPRDFIFDRPLWRVEYFLINDRNVRDDKEYVVDAITGELLNLDQRVYMDP